MSKLLVFKAPWCGPCKAMWPLLESSLKQRGDIEYQVINIDDDQASVDKWGIRAVPTIIVLDQQDNEIHRVSGGMNKQEIDILLDNF